MLRLTWVIVAVVLFAGPSLAQATNSDQLRPVELRPVYDRLDQIDQSIKKIDEKLTRLVELNASAAQREIAELRDMVKALRQEVADVTVRAGKEPSVSRKPGQESRGAMVVLANEHPAYFMDVLVNGERYQVVPGAHQSVSVPVGALTYRVLQTDPMERTRTIQAGETKIVTMR